MPPEKRNRQPALSSKKRTTAAMNGKTSSKQLSIPAALPSPPPTPSAGQTLWQEDFEQCRQRFGTNKLNLEGYCGLAGAAQGESCAPAANVRTLIPGFKRGRSPESCGFKLSYEDIDGNARNVELDVAFSRARTPLRLVCVDIRPDALSRHLRHRALVRGACTSRVKPHLPPLQAGLRPRCASADRAHSARLSRR